MSERDSSQNESRWTPEHRRLAVIASAGVFVSLGLGLITGWKADAHFKGKEIEDATAEGYLLGLGFGAENIPIEVTDGANILKVSCTPSDTDPTVVVDPFVTFNLDDSGNAFLVTPPLSDPDGQTYGEETITEYPLQTSEDINTFIGGALVDLCSSQN